MRGCFLGLLGASICSVVYAESPPSYLAANEGHSALIEANSALSLGEIILAFYVAIRDNTQIFEQLMQKADILLAPILAPMLIICAGARLYEEMQNPVADASAVLNIFYVTGAVVLLLLLYRTVLFQLTLFSNSVFAAMLPAGYAFEEIMQKLEDVMQEFEGKKSHANIIARWTDATLSLYSQYALAWASKWGLMILHGMLNYARNLLYAINYVLGMFLLPLLILKNHNLPRNWFIITLFIFLWTIIEGVLVAAVGELGVSALRSAIGTHQTLPAFATSIFYVMITTVNILIGLSLLAAIWILKVYFLSPGSIATMATALALPAVAMTRMMTRAAGSSRQMVLSGGSLPRRAPSLPVPPAQKGATVRRGPRKKPDDGLARPAPSLPKLRTIIEHQGALDKSSLPANVLTTARVGRRHKLR